MVELFDRDFFIQAGERYISARQLGNSQTERVFMKATFSIQKTSDPSPNKAKVSIHQLKEDSRKSIREGDPLIVAAGYVGNVQKIFVGTITFVSHRKQGTEIITTMEGGDGIEQYASSRMNISFTGGVAIKTLIQQAALSLGVGIGNALDRTNEGKFRKSFTQLTKGAVLSGRTNKILDRLCASTGLQWTIQDGNLQLLAPGETTQDQAVVLSSGDTGLIGSPEVSEKGIVRGQALLRPGIIPGHRLEIQSKFINGQFKTESVNHEGDTVGQNWYSNFEAKPIKLTVEQALEL